MLDESRLIPVPSIAHPYRRRNQPVPQIPFCSDDALLLTERLHPARGDTKNFRRVYCRNVGHPDILGASRSVGKMLRMTQVYKVLPLADSSEGRRDVGAKRRKRTTRGYGSHTWRAGRAKLQLADVLKIRELHDKGARYDVLAAMYNLHVVHVRNICEYIAWSTVLPAHMSKRKPNGA